MWSPDCPQPTIPSWEERTEDRHDYDRSFIETKLTKLAVEMKIINIISQYRHVYVMNPYVYITHDTYGQTQPHWKTSCVEETSGFVFNTFIVTGEV